MSRVWLCQGILRFRCAALRGFVIFLFLFLYFCSLPLQRFRGSGRGRLQDEHAITVTEEAVTLAHSFLVRTKNEFASSERAHQHQQSRTR